MIEVVKSFVAERALVWYPTAFVSDWHIGEGTKNDESIHNRMAALRFLFNFIRHEKRELVCVGDMFEMWQATPKEILTGSWSLLTALRSVQSHTTFLFGNHDYALSNSLLIPVKEEVLLYYNTEYPTVYATHGHQADWWNSKWRKRMFGRKATKVAECLDNAGIVDLFDQEAMKRYKDSPTKLQEAGKWGSREQEKYAKHVLSRSRNAPVAIYGHTHEPSINQDSSTGRILANCGSWTGPEERPLILVECNTVSLCLWK